MKDDSTRTAHPMHYILHPRLEPGYCECGCGTKTRIAPFDNGDDIKGQPRRFALGHNGRRKLPLFERRSDGCWVWLGHTEPFGHGIYARQKTHRLAWEYANGPIPDGLCVCHRCDVPSCINPDHLFLGTRADNIADMDAKGRRITMRGEQSGSAKLTAEQVAEIRRRYRAGARGIGVALAREYGVGKSAISAIVRGKSWAA